MDNNKVMIMFDTQDSRMKVKNYELFGIGVAVLDTYVEDQERRINKKELKNRLMKNKFTSHTANVFINTMLELDVFVEDGEDLIIAPITSNNFIRLSADLVRFCINVLSPFAFKLYCYLKRKYDLHVYKGYTENFMFTNSSLLEDMGWSRCQTNIDRLNDSLSVLEELGLIHYNVKGRYAKGLGKGQYKDLYWVKETCPAMEKAKKESKKDSILIETLSEQEVKLLNEGDAVKIQLLFDEIDNVKDTWDMVSFVNEKYSNMKEEIKELRNLQDIKAKLKELIMEQYK